MDLWETPPKQLVFMDRTVHVWSAFVDRLDIQPHEMVPLLSTDEQKRAGKYHRKRDAHRFVMRRGLLRKLLAGYLKIPADQLVFQTNPYGKLFIENRIGNPPLFFNTSHSNGFVLCAFSNCFEIGIDVEHVKAFSGLGDIVRRFFSMPEQLEFNSLPPEHLLQAFFKGWTCKEAFLKAVGKGLDNGLEWVQVSLDPRQKARLIKTDLDATTSFDWSLEIFEPIPEYVAALAVESKGEQFECNYWKWN